MMEMLYDFVVAYFVLLAIRAMLGAWGLDSWLSFKHKK